MIFIDSDGQKHEKIMIITRLAGCKLAWKTWVFLCTILLSSGMVHWSWVSFKIWIFIITYLGTHLCHFIGAKFKIWGKSVKESLIYDRTYKQTEITIYFIYLNANAGSNRRFFRKSLHFQITWYENPKWKILTKKWSSHSPSF